jgi:hypothetical protein
VDEINTVLGGLSGLDVVKAGLKDNKIILTSSETSADSSLKISVDASDPAAIQLGFQDGQTADDRQLSLFIATASTTNASLTFANNGTSGDGDTITRASGSWIKDGFKVGDVITVKGPAGDQNNGTYTIAALTDTVLTLTAKNRLTDESADGVNVTADLASGTASLTVNNLTASAHIGPVGIDVGSGSASGTVTLGLDVLGPDGGSRFDVVKDLSHVTVTPALTGSATLDLQDISVDAGLLSTPAGAHPALHVSVADFINHPDQVDVTTQDMDQLLSLQNLSLDQIIAALQNALHSLANYQSFSFLNNKLPVINKSIIDLIDFATPLVNDVNQLVNGLSLQQLNTRLDTLLGLPAGSHALQFSYDSTGKAFKLDLTLDDHVFSWLGFSKSLGFDLDMTTLTALLGNSPSDLSIKAFLKDLSSIVDVSGAATVNVSGSAAVTLDLGFDLDSSHSSDQYLHPFLYGDTGARLDAQFAATGINFTASVLGMGLYVENGTAYLNADGLATTTTPAEFAVGLGDASRRVYLGDLASAFPITLTGGLNVDLPVDFPVNTLSVGALGVSIPSLADLFNNKTDAVTFTTPDFSNLLDSFSSLLGIFTRPGALTGGIDALLGNVQTGLDDLGNSLPLVGTGLHDAAQFIKAFKDNLESRLNSVLGDLSPMQAVQQALFNFFGPTGLNLLAAPGSNARPGAGDPPGQDVQFAMTTDSATNDVQDVQFNMHLHGDVSTTVTLATDAGVPGLGLHVSDNVYLPVTLGWDLYLGFGYDTSHGDGFYIDLNPAHPHLLSVNVGVQVPSWATFAAQLGLLQLNVSDNTTTPSTEGLYGSFTVDLRDPDNNPRHRLTFATLAGSNPNPAQNFNPSQDIVAALNVNAALNLHLVVSYGSPVDDGSGTGAFLFPTVSTNFKLTWAFAFDTSNPTLTVNPPAIEFDHVTLDLGSFITNFAGPILKRIDGFFHKAQPLIDLLNFLDSPLPVLQQLDEQTSSDPGNHDPNHDGILHGDTTLLGVVGFLFPNLQPDINAAEDFLHIINQIQSLAAHAATGDVQLDLGSFNLNGFDAGKASNNLSTFTLPTSDITAAASVDSQLAGDASDASFVDSLDGGEMFTTGTDAGKGLVFPWIKQPTQLFGLLMGKPVQLVTFDSPTFSIDAPQLSIPVFSLFGILNVTIGGGLGAQLHALVGYDTTGLSEFLTDHRLIDLLDGFFVDASNTYIEADANVNVTANVNVVVADGGVTGELDARVRLQPNVPGDLPNDQDDQGRPADTPDPDDFVRWSTIRQELQQSNNNFLSLFAASGDVSARLYAWYQFFGGDMHSFDLFGPVTIVSFATSGGGGGSGTSGQTNGTATTTIPNTGVSVTAPGIVISNPRAVANPAPGTTPPAVNFPFGFVTFQASGVPSGGATVVILTLVETSDDPTTFPPAINAYYKFGPTLDVVNPDGSHPSHWYNFTYDPQTQTGAVIPPPIITHHTIQAPQVSSHVQPLLSSGGGGGGGGGTDTVYVRTTKIYLHYVDGQRGDNDLTANGVIVDPGAPAFVLPPAPPVPPPPSLPPGPVLLSPNERYVTWVYQDLFGVPPSAAVVAALANRLDRGVSRVRMVRDLLRSPEYRSQWVQSLYRTLLHRRPSKKELAQALRFLAHGGTLQQLEVWLFASAEYFQKRAGGTGAGFLQALFHDVLGQGPDPRTVLALSGLLTEASWRLEAATIMLRSVPADVQLVTGFYKRFLHVRPDGKSLRLSLSRLQRGVREEVVLADLLASPAYFAQVEGEGRLPVLPQALLSQR